MGLKHGGEILKCEMEAIKNTKSITKENITSTSNNIFFWNAKRNRHMASKGDNLVLNSEANS